MHWINYMVMDKEYNAFDRALEHIKKTGSGTKYDLVEVIGRTMYARMISLGYIVETNSPSGYTEWKYSGGGGIFQKIKRAFAGLFRKREESSDPPTLGPNFYYARNNLIISRIESDKMSGRCDACCFRGSGSWECETCFSYYFYRIVGIGIQREIDGKKVFTIVRRRNGL